MIGSPPAEDALSLRLITRIPIQAAVGGFPAIAISSFADLIEEIALVAALRETINSVPETTIRGRFLTCPETHTIVGNVIFMEERTSVSPWRSIAVRDRRYSIRYPFAADAELIDVESGATTSGVTSDLSIGGLFMCASKSFPAGTRVA